MKYDGYNGEITVQRETVLEHALHVLEREGIASTTLDMVAAEADYPVKEISNFGLTAKPCSTTLCVI